MSPCVPAILTVIKNKRSQVVVDFTCH